jgi:hypothetical protein
MPAVLMDQTKSPDTRRMHVDVCNTLCRPKKPSYSSFATCTHGVIPPRQAKTAVARQPAALATPACMQRSTNMVQNCTQLVSASCTPMPSKLALLLLRHSTQRSATRNACTWRTTHAGFTCTMSFAAKSATAGSRIAAT